LRKTNRQTNSGENHNPATAVGVGNWKRRHEDISTSIW